MDTDRRIRALDPDPDADPDPAIFIFDLQDANKKQMWKKVFLLPDLEPDPDPYFWLVDPDPKHVDPDPDSDREHCWIQIRNTEISIASRSKKERYGTIWLRYPWQNTVRKKVPYKDCHSE